MHMHMYVHAHAHVHAHVPVCACGYVSREVMGDGHDVRCARGQCAKQRPTCRSPGWDTSEEKCRFAFGAQSN
eukprot:7117273-Prymnesium_polylepis.1